MLSLTVVYYLDGKYKCAILKELLLLCVHTTWTVIEQYLELKYIVSIQLIEYNIHFYTLNVVSLYFY